MRPRVWQLDREPTGLDGTGFDPARDLDVAGHKPGIRCPVCQWRPHRTSRWFCSAMGAPEHFDGGCGHRWNTFDTAGLCPVCQHQWRHTSCLVCGATSPHAEWYEREQPGRTGRHGGRPA